jgi:hypothetical protein
MTYKELYLKGHPDVSSDELQDIIDAFCPGDFWEGNPEADESCELACFDCWNKEIPEDIMDKILVKAFESDHILEPKTLTKEDIRKLGLGLTPVIEDIEVKPEVEIGGVKVQSTDHGTCIKDSGSRREFSTGAVRDIQEGKGRCDLMPLDVIADYMEVDPNERDWVLWNIEQYQRSSTPDMLYIALSHFGKKCDWDGYTMMLEVAKHFEAGAAKYGEWNWQKGIPTHCYIDSAVRHYLKFLRGDKDEPHDRAFVWNILCCIWTCKHKPELNDYPRKEKADA